jgi:hypothetical protein
MQRELFPIDFSTQAEVRLDAEHRRTEEVSGLLRNWFGEGLARFRQLARPVLQTVAHSRQSVASENRLAGFDRV